MIVYMNKESIEKLKKLTLLIVDDNKKYLKNTANSLSMFFKDIYTASNNKDALSNIKKSPNIILLDIELTDTTGIELAKIIKVESPKSFIIFISGFSEKEYLLSAIKLNVVDYIIKPATLDVLLESFKKVIDSYEDELLVPIHFAKEFTFYPESQSLYKNDKEIVLGIKERKLFILLLDNINKIVTKEEIAQTVWPYTYMSESSLKNLILELRKKIGKENIINTQGVGWRLISED